MGLILLLYVIFLIFAEIAITTIPPSWSLLFLIVIITSLIILSSLSVFTKFSRLLQALILIPLLRIMSLSISMADLGPVYGLALIILPLSVSCIFLMRGQNLSIMDVGLNLKKLPIQLLIIWGGLAIGFIEYLILEPAAIISNLEINNLIISVIILLCTGFILELIFRGIIQQEADDLMGKIGGLLFVSILFTSQYIAWNSVPYLGFVFGVSIIYGYIYQKTSSILGISVSHGLSNVMLFLILPLSAI
jgi:membrane protease YdiL (CAAX protease family)